jgi:predicted nucleic acid-binding protein
VDFAPLYASGVLTVLTLETTELGDYINFAAEMDDGEAMTCAIAGHRGGAVATDDRKARRVLTQDAPHLRLLSTLDLVHDWAFQQQIASAALRRALMNIRDRATYIPARSHALRAWWDISI